MRAALIFLSLIFCCFVAGCDRIYGLLHKPGGEEQQILGAFVFNEYSAKVEEVQKVLKGFGYNIGRVDGKFGAALRDAVAKFQADEGLTVTRFVDKATWGRMQEYRQGPLFANGALDGKAVQKALNKAGFSAGKVDGRIGPRSRQALKDFQRSQGLEADGQIGLKTIKALLKYLEPPVAPVQ